MAKSKKPVSKTRGPYLAAAVFCHAILEDKSDSAVSLIRIVDTIIITLPNDHDPEQKIPISANLFISFKTGDARGEKTFRLVLETPKRKRSLLKEEIVNFAGPEQGALNIRINVHLGIKSEGIFWFDVMLDGKRFTRMPLLISFQKAPTQMPDESQTGAEP